MSSRAASALRCKPAWTGKPSCATPPARDTLVTGFVALVALASASCDPTPSVSDSSRPPTVAVAPVGGSTVGVVAETRERAPVALDPKAPLDLVVYVRADGFAVAVQGQPPRGICGDRGKKVTLRLLHDKHDFAGLRHCLATIKSHSSAFASERRLTLNADPGVQYQVVIETIDAVRETADGKPLFPDVRFGVARLP